MGCTVSKATRSEAFLVSGDATFRQTHTLLSPAITESYYYTCLLFPITAAFARNVDLKCLVSKNAVVSSSIVDYLSYNINPSLKSLAELKQRLLKWRRDLAALRADLVGARASVQGLLFLNLSSYKLRKVRCEQKLMLEELRKRKEKLEKKQILSRGRRSFWSRVFKAGFLAVLVISVTLAAVKAPTVAIDGTAATGMALKDVAEPWNDERWKEREGTLESAVDLIDAMVRGGGVLRRKLKRIQRRTRQLEKDVVSALARIDIREESVVNDIEKIETEIEGIKALIIWIERQMQKEAFELLNVVGYTH